MRGESCGSKTTSASLSVWQRFAEALGLCAGGRSRTGRRAQFRGGCPSAAHPGAARIRRVLLRQSSGAISSRMCQRRIGANTRVCAIQTRTVSFSRALTTEASSRTLCSARPSRREDGRLDASTVAEQMPDSALTSDEVDVLAQPQSVNRSSTFSYLSVAVSDSMVHLYLHSSSSLRGVSDPVGGSKQ